MHSSAKQKEERVVGKKASDGWVVLEQNVRDLFSSGFTARTIK